MDGHYGLPSGKVEQDEPFTQAAVREAKEEADVTIEIKDLTPVLTVCRANLGNHAPYWIDVFFEVATWTGEPRNAEPHKHSELVWLDLDDLPENIVPAVKFSLEQIQKGNTYAEYGWDD